VTCFRATILCLVTSKLHLCLANYRRRFYVRHPNVQIPQSMTYAAYELIGRHCSLPYKTPSWRKRPEGAREVQLRLVHQLHLHRIARQAAKKRMIRDDKQQRLQSLRVGKRYAYMVSGVLRLRKRHWHGGDAGSSLSLVAWVGGVHK
jgi:hypothetical protein